MLFLKKKNPNPILSSTSADLEKSFTASLVDIVSPILGKEKVEKIWKAHVGEILTFSGSGQAFISPRCKNVELKAFSLELLTQLAHIFGTEFSESHAEFIFLKLRKLHGEKGISTLFSFMPPDFLEEQRIRYLSKEELERLFTEKQKLTKALLLKEKELTALNSELKELDEVKNEFVSVAAHQLRTPLSGIKWTLKLLLDGELGPLTDDQRKFIQKSFESNDRLIVLVNEMLNVDRIRAGTIEYLFENVKMFDLVQSVLHDLEPISKNKNQKIILDAGNAELPLVRVDVEKIRAVFQNLLENAIKYTPIDGSVKILLRTDNKNFSVCVEDSGIGIPKSEQKFIFQRFFRASNAKKVHADGSGLGLFFIQKIIEKHGGKIWFESDESHGTRFYFTVPLEANK